MEVMLAPAPARRRLRHQVLVMVGGGAATPRRPATPGEPRPVSWMREQLAAATAAEAELKVESPMLSEQELEFFRRFGYVHRRALFSKSEMDAIYRGTDEALAARGFPRGEHVDWRGPTDGPHECSVASHPELSRLLLEDRRLWGPIEQLLGQDFVLINVGNGEGGGGFTPNTWEGREEAGLPPSYQEQ